MKLLVKDALHYGRENAISSKQLAAALGFPSVRELQAQVAREREAGAAILCDSHGAGYYLSNDPEEILRFTRTLDARARNTARASKAVKRSITAATGQEVLEGFFDG